MVELGIVFWEILNKFVQLRRFDCGVSIRMLVIMWILNKTHLSLDLLKVIYYFLPWDSLS